MKILILNWRDTLNPAGGGAEVYLREISKRWVLQGHEVTFFCAAYPGGLAEQVLDGIKIIRQGNRFSVYWKAYRFYKSFDPEYFDAVVDSINTIPFFTPWYVKGKRVALIYQLAKEVWFYETFFPINILGYLLEPLYLRFYRKESCVTISESSRKDLRKLGYNGKIPVLNPGIFAVPLKGLPQKESQPTLIYVGRLKKSKRVHHILKAFQTIQKEIPRSQLWIVGSGDPSYQTRLEKDIHKHHIQGVTFWGYVDEDKKMELMRRSHLILVTSIREGWGIIVIEAAAMGTPAVVYDIPGLRDSVQHHQTGLVIDQNQTEFLAREVIHLLNSPERWHNLARGALQKSQDYRWDHVADQFLTRIQEV